MFSKSRLIIKSGCLIGTIGFLNILFTYGLETAFFHFSNKIDDKERVYSTALISIFGTSISLSLLFIGFSGSIAEFIKEPEHINYIIWCVLIVATDALMAIPFARFRLNNQARKFGMLKLLNVFVFILICIFTIFIFVIGRIINIRLSFII